MPRKSPSKHPTTYRIEITQAIIDKAVRENSAHCVVADAVHQQIPGASMVDVDTQLVRFSLKEYGERLMYLTPRTVAEYVINFDAGDNIEPFSFTLQKPAAIVAMKGSTRDRAQLPSKPTVSKATAGSPATRIGGTVPAPFTRKRRFGLRGLRINKLAVSDRPEPPTTAI